METPEKRRPGRPEGAANKMAREAREQAKLTGLLPNEILLSMARGEIQTEFELDPRTGKYVSKEVALNIEQRMDAAKAAAPYYAPKISTVEVITGVPDNELDRIIAQLAAEAGIDLGNGGEEQEDQVSPPARKRVALQSRRTS